MTPVVDNEAAVLVDFAGAAAAIGHTPAELEERSHRRGYRRRFPQSVTTVDGEPRWDVAEVRDWAVWLGYATPEGDRLIGYPEIAALCGIGKGRARHLLEIRNRNIKETGKPGPRDIAEPYASFEDRGPGPWPRPMWLVETGDPNTGILDWAVEIGRYDPVTGETHHQPKSSARPKAVPSSRMNSRRRRK